MLCYADVSCAEVAAGAPASRLARFTSVSAAISVVVGGVSGGGGGEGGGGRYVLFVVLLRALKNSEHRKKVQPAC